jgi:Uma2 family endonuclease
MATSSQISLQDYLHSNYRPDREYLDGELRERNVGKYEHARIQAWLTAWFFRNEAAWGVQVVTEQRVQVKPGRVRIPDVALLSRGPQPEIIRDPPILVVEVLSPDDRFRETRERIDDFFAMGVKSVWILDPESRTGEMWLSKDRCVAAGRLEVPGAPIWVEVAELFAALDGAAE